MNAMHGFAMAAVALGLSVATLGPRKPEAPPMSKPLRALANVCEERRGVSTEAFERHLARKGSAAWTMAVVGKDAAARGDMVEQISEELGVPVVEVQASELVGRYIGETEKNLDALLKAAEARGAVLFFDEADALFGKRTDVADAGDRYADPAASTIPTRLREAQTMAFVGVRTKLPHREGLRDAVVAAPKRDAQRPEPVEPPWRALCWRPSAD